MALAISDEELLIVSCKRGSLDRKGEEDEWNTFNLAKDFLLHKPPFKGLSKSKDIKFVYVAEYISKRNREFFVDKGVIVIELKDIVEELFILKRDEMDPKKLDGMDEHMISRFIKFLIKHKIPNPYA